ncbi:hypothetical protein MBLNU13_g00489t1 [Cladosporium sp. NU13]
MSTMYRRFLEALMTLSGTSSCFPRPARAPENGCSHDSSQTTTANGKPCIETQPAINPITKQQLAAKRSQTSSVSEEDHISNPQTLTRRTSSSSSTSSTPASSLRSLPSTLRASLTHRISSWQTNHSDPWPIEDAVEHTKGEAFTSANTATTPSESDNEDFIASLDALALSQHEREVLGRMQLVCRSARAARERRLRTKDWNDLNAINGMEPGLYLRGGGSFSSDDNVRPFRTPRRRTTLPVEEPVFPKADSERPPRGLWWFAGGRKGMVPTVGELRVRKEVERANRRTVGFWGTVLRVRRVGKVGILGEGGDGGGDDAVGDGGGGGGDDGCGVLENAVASPSQGSKTIGSIVGAPGAGGGGSLASSHREREIEMDQPVEAKAESVMSVTSADDGATHAKTDAVDGTAKDQRSTKPGSLMDTGLEEPKAGSESAKSVAEDHESSRSRSTKESGTEKPKAGLESAKSVAGSHESAKTGSVKDVGAEEPRAKSESASSVAEDTRAEAGSVRSREGVVENVGETETKSSSNG